MAYLDNLALVVLALIGLLLGLGLVLLTFKRYEIAVLILAITSCTTMVLQPNVASSVLEDTEAGIGSYVKVCMFLLMGCAGLLQFLKLRMGKTDRIPIDFMLLAGFILFALLSSVYSIDQRISLERSLYFVAFFAFLLGFYCWLQQSNQLHRVINLIFGFAVAGAAANLFLFLAWPDHVWWWAMDDRFKGFFNEPNSMGQFCMISYPICLWKYSDSSPRFKWVVVTTIAALAVTHVLTGSRSTMIASALGIFLWMVFSKRTLKRVLLFLGIGVVAIGLGQVNPSRFEREYGSGPTTGRTDLWEGAYALLKEKPLLGYGYEVEGKIFEDPRYHDPRFALWRGSARLPIHNGYLSMALGVGLAGFFLWSAVLLLPFVKSMWLPRSDEKLLVISVMSMCLFVNSVESLITGGRSLTAILYWLMWVITLKLPGMEAKG
jgi:O-antigen ligase